MSQRIASTEMGTRVITILAMLSLLSGCEWVSTAVRTSVDVGVMLAADRSLLNVADDYSIKSEITSALFDEALSLNVSTDVYQGMVMLTGAVKEEKDKQKAEKLARQARGVRELFNEIQVTTEVSIADRVSDLVMENKLKAKLVFAAGLTSINFRWRAVNSVIYFMGMAKSREELDRVITLARMSGVQRIVSHVFLTDAFVFDGAPEPAAREIAEPERGKTVKAVASAESDAARKKMMAKENADYEKLFPKRAPPGVPPEMPTYYERSIEKLY
jgi:osmotically-inducible protein OsmY